MQGTLAKKKFDSMQETETHLMLKELKSLDHSWLLVSCSKASSAGNQGGAES